MISLFPDTCGAICDWFAVMTRYAKFWKYDFPVSARLRSNPRWVYNYDSIYQIFWNTIYLFPAVCVAIRDWAMIMATMPGFGIWFSCVQSPAGRSVLDLWLKKCHISVTRFHCFRTSSGRLVISYGGYGNKSQSEPLSLLGHVKFSVCLSRWEEKKRHRTNYYLPSEHGHRKNDWSLTFAVELIDHLSYMVFISNKERCRENLFTCNHCCTTAACWLKLAISLLFGKERPKLRDWKPATAKHSDATLRPQWIDKVTIGQW